MTGRIVTSNETARRTTLWHLWVVGILAVLWNGYGATDYVMSQMRDEAWLGQVPGVSAADMIAYLDAMPVWMEAAWAIGVWGALAAAILLLMRRRLAVAVYLVSILGMIFSLGLDLAGIVDKPEALQRPELRIMGVVVFIAAIAQLLYARWMSRRGVLR